MEREACTEIKEGGGCTKFSIIYFHASSKMPREKERLSGDILIVTSRARRRRDFESRRRVLHAGKWAESVLRGRDGHPLITSGTLVPSDVVINLWSIDFLLRLTARTHAGNGGSSTSHQDCLYNPTHLTKNMLRLTENTHRISQRMSLINKLLLWWWGVFMHIKVF